MVWRMIFIQNSRGFHILYRSWIEECYSRGNWFYSGVWIMHMSEILHHTGWRTWHFIAYSDERGLYYQFSFPVIHLFQRSRKRSRLEWRPKHKISNSSVLMSLMRSCTKCWYLCEDMYSVSYACLWFVAGGILYTHKIWVTHHKRNNMITKGYLPAEETPKANSPWR